MKRKKNKISENEILDEEENEILDDNEDIIDSSLEIGGQIHAQSDIIKRHAHLPEDVKYSNFGRIDLGNFILKSNAYQLWQYTKKIERISKIEINNLKQIKKELYNIETLEDLKEYLEKNKKGHIWHNLINNFSNEDLKKEFQELLKQIKDAVENGVIDYIYSEKETFNEAYNEYIGDNGINENIDDFGLINTMMTLTEVNKAKKGWATKMMNTTISVTKEEDLKEEVEERPEESENKGFKKYFKK